MDEPPASQQVVTDQTIIGTPARCTKCDYDLKGLPDDVPCPECGTMPSRVVHIPRYCISCGYMLIGLPIAGPCPECGTPVALSLREPWLASAGRAYLESLRKGFTMVLNGILWTVVLGAAMILLSSLIAFGVLPVGMALVELAGTGFGLVISAMLYVGYWHATTPDPANVAEETPSSPRNVVRGTVLAQGALQVVQMVLQAFTLTGGTGPSMLLDIATTVLGVLGLVAWAVQYFAMMRYVRWLAGRVPDSFVIHRTKRYMWLLPVLTIVGAACVFIGPLVALVLYWNLLNRFNKHVKSILTTGEPEPLAKM